MSEVSEVKNVSLLQSITEQRAGFIQQRDMMQTNFQQLVGAIFACDVLIKQHEETLKKELADELANKCPEGDKENVEAVEQEQVEAA